MKKDFSLKEIRVGIDFGQGVEPVGRLAIRERAIYFEYMTSFIERGIQLSPLKLPLKAGVTKFSSSLFEGLPGVFNDSLPDGWGRLLFDRFARSQGIMPEEITPLDRLSHVGVNGMGALVYEPEHKSLDVTPLNCLDELFNQSQEVLSGGADDVLETLLALNGSSAGARPKALINVDRGCQHISHGVAVEGYEPWIVKFMNTQDGPDAGAIEYVYSLMAKEAGIQMPQIHLFPSQTGAGYFASKRFDQDHKQRFHMHTALGLLHSDFRIPSLDYETLIALTGILTRDVREIEKMFQRAVFNILSYNRDDHGKNFSFLMNEDKEWRLSPGYDLTFSSGPRGEHSTLVMGEGKNPKLSDLIKLGNEAKISRPLIDRIIDQTRHALSQWKGLAQEYGVRKSNIKLIHDRIHSIS